MLSENVTGGLSSKRLITVVVAIVFIISCFITIGLLLYIFAYVTKTQNVNTKALKEVTDLLRDVIYYEFMIVIAGLGYITAPQFAAALNSSLPALFRSRMKTGYGSIGYEEYDMDIPKGKIEIDEDGEKIG